MVEIANQGPTWSLYPSLHQSLTSDQLQSLEAAVQAHHCGRYNDALRIYDEELPEAHTILLLTLEKSDMLTAQGNEHAKIALLESALANATNLVASDIDILLLKTLLADAKLWARGEIKQAYEQAKPLREYFFRRSPSALTDIEIRCVLAYYIIIKACNQSSNFPEESDSYLFQLSEGSSENELSTIRGHLQSQNRLVDAVRIGIKEIDYLSGSALADCCQSLLHICSTLETSTHPALIFRSISTRMILCPHFRVVNDESAAVDCSKRTESLLKEICPDPSAIQAFSPRMHIKQRMLQISGSNWPHENKMIEYFMMAKKAADQGDWTGANQLYIKSVDEAMANGNESPSLENHRKTSFVVAQYHKFHAEQTETAFFVAHSLSRHCTVLSIFRDYQPILEELGKFENAFPTCDIPQILERLFDQGRMAAYKLNLRDAQATYTRKQDLAFISCNFVSKDTGQVIHFSDEPERDQTYYFLELHSEDHIFRGQKAIGLILRWATAEYKVGLLHDAYLVELFQLQRVTGFLLEELDQFLTRSDAAEEIAHAVFGFPKPCPSSEWIRFYSQLRHWLLLLDKKAPLKTRIFALRVLGESRAFRVRTHMFKTEITPDVTFVREIAAERDILSSIIRLDEQESPSHMLRTLSKKTSDVFSDAQDVLVLSWAPKSAKDQIVTDDRLRDATEALSGVILEAQKLQNEELEYNIHHLRAKLLFERHMLFKSVAAEECFPSLEAAEAIVSRLRQNISAISGQTGVLEAKSHLYGRILHEHICTFGVFVSFIAFQGHTQNYDKVTTNSELKKELQEKMSQAAVVLFVWSQRSKSRSLVDILGLAAGIPKSLVDSYTKSEQAMGLLQAADRIEGDLVTASLDEQNELHMRLVDVRQQMRQHPLLKPVMEIRDGDSISAKRADQLVRDIPPGVALVDIIYNNHLGTFIALIYRRWKQAGLISLNPVSLKQVQDWVKHNIDDAKKQRIHPLAKGDTERLRQLSGLIKPFVDESRNYSYIDPGETIVFFLTKELHRVPFHALLVENDSPLIERNPVVYNHSISVLKSCVQYVQERNTSASLKSVVVNPMPDFWDKRKQDPVESTPFVREFATSLQATLEHGFELTKAVVEQTMRGSSLVHYHGHVSFNVNEPMKSGFILNNRAYTRNREEEHGGMLYASDIMNIKLQQPALATIIGCQSGISQISRLDDLLGLQAALHIAGASVNTTTLWKIRDRDGVAFTREFYAAIKEQECAAAEAPLSGSPFAGLVDLAKAMQKALLNLRKAGEDGKVTSAYNWAGFVLNGYWMYPALGLKDFKVPDLPIMTDKPSARLEDEE